MREKSTPLTPLEYLLAVMRDAKADQARRDAAAIALLPYCHEAKSPIPDDDVLDEIFGKR